MMAHLSRVEELLARKVPERKRKGKSGAEGVVHHLIRK